ncbi:MAG: hypothetical protein Q7J67_00210 [bacterium]|nr:hypothetical protein [bacterium]
MNDWKALGKLKSKDSVYYNTKKNKFAVEKDHSCLVEPTPAEKLEIIHKWPKAVKKGV